MNYSTEVTAEQLNELNFDVTFDADRTTVVTSFAAREKGEKAQGARRYWSAIEQVRAVLDTDDSVRGADAEFSAQTGLKGPQVSCLKFLGRIGHLAATGNVSENVTDAAAVKVRDGLQNLERFYAYDKSPGDPSLTMLFMAIADDSATGMNDITRGGAAVRTYGTFGDVQMAARIARGEIRHAEDPLNGEHDDEGDEGDDEKAPADPAETFRLAIAQATAALGADEVRRIFMASQAV